MSMSLRRKMALRESAARDAGVARRLAGISRAGQVARTTVPVGESDLPVVGTLEQAVDTAVTLPGVVESADQAGSDAYEAAIRVDEAKATADGAAADALAAAQAAADANAAASAAGVAAAGAQSAADAASTAAAQAAQDATDKSAAAEAAAKAYAEAQAAAAEAAAVAEASGDATAKAAAAQAAAEAAAALDAKAKADAAEAAAKADAAAAQSTADQAVSDAAAAQSAADAAQGAADSVRFLAEGLYQAIPSVTAPTVSPSGPLKQGDMWFVIGAAGTPVAGKFVGVQVWDGAAWVPREMLADSLMVVGPDGVVYVANGKVTAAALAVDALNFKTATGMTLTSGQIIGSDIRTALSGQRMQLDIEGLRAFAADGSVSARLYATSGGLALTGPLTSYGVVGGTDRGIAFTPDEISWSRTGGSTVDTFFIGLSNDVAYINTARRAGSGDAPALAIGSKTTFPGNSFSLKSQLEAWAPIAGTHAWVTSEGREYVRASGAWRVVYEDTGWADVNPSAGFTFGPSGFLRAKRTQAGLYVNIYNVTRSSGSGLTTMADLSGWFQPGMDVIVPLSTESAGATSHPVYFSAAGLLRGNFVASTNHRGLIGPLPF